MLSYLICCYKVVYYKGNRPITQNAVEITTIATVTQTPIKNYRISFDSV